MHLHAENFQAWEEFDLDIEGLTAIVGPSDTGKSSFARAIRGVVRNEVDANQIRVGASEVIVSLDNITLERPAKNSAFYRMGKDVFDKLNKGVPKPVTDLQMGALRIGDVVVDPIFSDQHDPKFMLQGMGDTALNAVLGAFSSTQKLEMGKREANARINAKNSEARVIAKEIQEAEARKFDLETLEGKLAPAISAVSVLDKKIAVSRTKLQETQGTRQTYTRVSSLRRVMKGLRVPDTLPVERKSQQVLALRSALTNKAALVKHQELLGQLETVSSLWTVTATKYRKWQNIQKVMSLRTGDSQKAKQGVEELDRVLSEYESGTERVTKVRSKLRLVKSLITSLNNRELLQKDTEELEKLAAAVESERDLLEAESNEKQVECPQCGEKFIPEVSHGTAR